MREEERPSQTCRPVIGRVRDSSRWCQMPAPAPLLLCQSPKQKGRGNRDARARFAAFSAVIELTLLLHSSPSFGAHPFTPSNEPPSMSVIECVRATAGDEAASRWWGDPFRGSVPARLTSSTDHAPSAAARVKPAGPPPTITKSCSSSAAAGGGGCSSASDEGDSVARANQPSERVNWRGFGRVRAAVHVRARALELVASMAR